jgi:hypothetical protein
MRKTTLLALCVFLLAADPSKADGWSVGVGTGPFVFGDFAERRTLVTTELGGVSTSARLSAATRPGGSADLERDINGWLGVRLDAAWTRAPMRVKGSGGSGVTIDAGRASITTFALPLVVHINRHGAFRVHLAAGPAYGIYSMKGRAGGGATLPLFEGTHGRWGGVAGGGLGWWLSDRFAVEGEIDDIVTSSPFKRSDFGSSTFGRLKIPKTHNVHTTAGIRYRF